MKIIKNIYKGWKTTVIGIMLFITGLAYVILNPTPDFIVLSILLASGVAMLFFPDNVIEELDKLIKTKSTKL